jgi:hypothetical protein
MALTDSLRHSADRGRIDDNQVVISSARIFARCWSHDGPIESQFGGENFSSENANSRTQSTEVNVSQWLTGRIMQ